MVMIAIYFELMFYITGFQKEGSLLYNQAQLCLSDRLGDQNATP